MTRHLAFVFVVLVVGLPGLANARPRVALLQLEGDPGGEVQDAVNAALESDLALLGPSQVKRTIDKLGFDSDLTERDLKKLANELEADAIVQGKVSSGEDDHRILHVRLFHKGKKVKGFKVEFNVAGAKFKSALHDKMLEKLGIGEAKSDDPPAETKPAKKDKDKDKDAKKKKKGADDDAAETADAKPTKKDKDKDAKKKGKDKGESAEETAADDTKKKKDGDIDIDGAPKQADVDAQSKTDDPAGDDTKKKDQVSDDEKSKKKKRTAKKGMDDDDEELSARAGADVGVRDNPHSANHVAIRLDVGPSLTSRKLSFNSKQFDVGPGSIGPPKGYANSAVPGVRVAGVLFPGALSNPRSAAAGFGVYGELDQTVGLSVQNSLQAGTKFAVTEKRWSAGVRYRIAFGPSPTAPTITLGVGYGHRAFKIDRHGLMDGLSIDIPDVEYVGIDPGAEFRVPLVKSVAMVFGGRALLVSRTGSIQKPEEYGQAKVTGGEGTAGLDIVFGNRYALNLSGYFMQMGFVFTGNGAMSNARDGDPSNKDVGGAADRYVGGAATFGILY